MGRYRAIYTENQNGDGYEAEKNKAEKIRLHTLPCRLSDGRSSLTLLSWN